MQLNQPKEEKLTVELDIWRKQISLAAYREVCRSLLHPHREC